MVSLANAARAAGFAMAAGDDDAEARARQSDDDASTAGNDIYDALSAIDVSVTTAANSQFGGPGPKVVLADTFSRWQGTSKPVALADMQSARSGSMFGWLPSFNWRLDGR
jgi:hypothetical protein